MAFGTRYGQFDYPMKLLGLSEAPGCFQTYNNIILTPYLDSFIFVYLDDILIYSKNEHDNISYVNQALEVLRKNKLYGKLTNCYLMKT